MKEPERNRSIQARAITASGAPWERPQPEKQRRCNRFVPFSPMFQTSADDYFKNSFAMKTIIYRSFLLLFVSALIGCGQNVPDDFPKIYPVKLRIMQEGKPLEHAPILLRSTDQSSTWTVGGVSDATGTVTLWTHGKYQGAPAGQFKVLVSKVVNEGEAEYLAALNREDAVAARKIDVKSFSLVEERFESEATTPLEIEITPKTRIIDIDAGPAVRIRRAYLK